MDRSIRRLTEHTFDVAVVGGGILGAFIALLAARRGARVALLEKNDFASGTTSGSGKVLHGGIRYLQSLRLGLARQAQREQRALAQIVPDLVRPLPFLVPCRPGRTRERVVLKAGTAVWRGFRWLTRNGVELPTTRWMGEREVQELTGGLEQTFRGGMLFHDLQLRSPERFTFEIVRRAAQAGAVVVNYAEVTGLRITSSSLEGLEARDRLDGGEFKVDVERVVNAAGAWAPEVVEDTSSSFPDVALGKGIHVVVDRPEPPVALALPFRGEDSHEPTAADERRVFVMPWEGRTLVGASYSPLVGQPDKAAVTKEEIGEFLGEINRQWPGLRLDDSRVLFAYSGLYPVFGQRRIAEGRYAASLHPLILDHAEVGGPAGLVSAMSVKLTTARALAERVVDMALKNRGATREKFMAGTKDGRDRRIPPSDLPDAPPFQPGEAADLPSVALRAARQEMATSLGDVLFRRSWIGHLGHPGRALLEKGARAMAGVLGWPEEEVKRQVDEIESLYSSLGATTDPAELSHRRRPSRGSMPNEQHPS